MELKKKKSITDLKLNQEKTRIMQIREWEKQQQERYSLTNLENSRVDVFSVIKDGKSA